MIDFTRAAGMVTLSMSEGEFQALLLVIGYAAGAAQSKGDKAAFWKWIRLANQVNEGNPNFDQYEIPEEFRQ